MEKAGAFIFIDPKSSVEMIKNEIIANLDKWKPEKIPFAGCIIIPKNLSIEKNEITPTHKIVRKDILKNYKKYIEGLYYRNILKLENYILRF